MIRVLVAEDQHLIRGALVALIGLEDDMEVVADLERGDEIEPIAVRTQPDVAVLDIDLPGSDGLTAAQRPSGLGTQLPGAHLLTGLTQPSHLLRALESRVRGFVPKDAPADQLADGIRRIAAGERVLDPTLVAAALETGSNPLTARETDVLRTAAGGISTEEIANTFYLTAGTVRNYLSNAIAKLGARNRIDAIRIAREAGWL